MQIADPLGMPGAPLETLNAVMTRMQGSETRGGRLVMVTDSTGHRDTAGYAALLVTGPLASSEVVVTTPSFGPRYGLAGVQALSALARWAQEREWPLKETVLSAADFMRVIEEPDAQEIAGLIAASNPADAAIYTHLPKSYQEELERQKAQEE